ncbi:MAG TPA: glycosyltransferase family 4 protein [Anaerolineae bacterium]|nr:glycosyltransferase family 4 protein [Anaerolineae bacterium]
MFSKKVAYLLGAFPNLTTTFIDREILETERQIGELVLVSIRRLPPFEMRPEAERLAQRTHYLLPAPWLGLLQAHLYFLVTRFGAYLATLGYLLSRSHTGLAARLKTLAHFGVGVWAAWILRPERVDHLHAHFADRAAVVALVASRLLTKPYSLTAHANDIYVSPVLLPEKLANAKFVTTCTGYNKSYLERLTGRPVELVYHGLDFSQIGDALSSGVDRIAAATNGKPALILAVGQLKEKKGFPDLIQACRLLKQQGYQFRCEIIGEGPQRRELEALITALALADVVGLCGALPNAAVMARYRQATLFALPCVVAKDDDRDGIPNVVLEAMAHGVPVVSTRVSGIPEVVEHNITGLLVEPGNPEALAEAIAALFNDKALRQRLAQQGQRQVQENFDIQTNIERLLKLLEV